MLTWSMLLMAMSKGKLLVQPYKVTSLPGPRGGGLPLLQAPSHCCPAGWQWEIPTPVPQNVT